jgi:hypothetical protein
MVAQTSGSTTVIRISTTKDPFEITRYQSFEQSDCNQPKKSDDKRHG